MQVCELVEDLLKCDQNSDVEISRSIGSEDWGGITFYPIQFVSIYTGNEAEEFDLDEPSTFCTIINVSDAEAR